MEDDHLLKRAKQRALRLLSLRARSKMELRAKLKERGFDDHVIDSVTVYLLERKYLDDNSFATNWARSLAVNRLLGNLRIEMSLRKKGISGESIGEAIDAAREEISEREAIGRLIDKRAKGRMIADLNDKEIRRLRQNLLMRGFPAGMFFEMLEREGKEY
ncbi:MAG: RecX family transcriptional regulator [Syntrophales bacterium]